MVVSRKAFSFSKGAKIVGAFAFFLFIISCSLGAADGSPALKNASGDIFILPRNATGNLPVLVVLPGKNVPASSEKNNWEFSASKNQFAMIVMDVDYSAIQSDDAVERFHDRIRSKIGSLDSPEVTLNKKKVYLAGTSMGGMMAIALTLKYPTDYVATSVVCGSRLYFGAKQSLLNAVGRRFYLAHGSEDKVVSFQSFEETKNALEAQGAVVTTRIYPGGGHIISGAYNEAVNWLASISKSSK